MLSPTLSDTLISGTSDVQASYPETSYQDYAQSSTVRAKVVQEATLSTTIGFTTIVTERLTITLGSSASFTWRTLVSIASLPFGITFIFMWWSPSAHKRPENQSSQIPRPHSTSHLRTCNGLHYNVRVELLKTYEPRKCWGEQSCVLRTDMTIGVQPATIDLKQGAILPRMRRPT